MTENISDRLALALQANAKLSDDVMRKLADEASRATDGQVYHAYTTVPSRTPYYVFGGSDGMKKNRAEAYAYLRGVVARKTTE